MEWEVCVSVMSPGNEGGLCWPPLISGVLQRRYKRFLADIRLDDGRPVTAHCPNSGSMKGCSEAGRPVLLSEHDHPRRKLRYTWELIDMGSSWVGVNTLVPNRLVSASVAAGKIPDLTEYERIRREIPVGSRSRIDLLLESRGRRPCYVEIKNCTLVEAGRARFPDAVTTRGRKHLLELERLSASGCRAVTFFLVQRMDAEGFSPADDIDPAYGAELRRVHRGSVEILAYDVHVDPAGIALRRRLPLML